MTQGKKKKRAANRSIMLAKKIIIKDGGTVSPGSAPQGGPGAGPAGSSLRFRLRPAGSALPSRTAGAAAVSACGLRAWLLREPAASAHVRPAAGRRRLPLGSFGRPSAARGEAGQSRSLCCGGWPLPLWPAGPGYVRCRGRGRREPGAGSRSGLGHPVEAWTRLLSGCPKPYLTTWGGHSLSFREIITLCLKNNSV